MSATNRSDVRRPDDFYETPAWCVRRLLEAVDLPGGVWIEPSAGHGAIIKAVNAIRSDVRWAGFEIRPEAREHLDPLVFNHGSVNMDFLKTNWLDTPAVVIGNPPYSQAMEFVTHALYSGAYVAFLLRLNFLGSDKRSAFMRGHMPDVYVLPNRPSFTGGGTDAIEYAWMVWPPNHERYIGHSQVLKETSRQERR